MVVADGRGYHHPNWTRCSSHTAATRPARLPQKLDRPQGAGQVQAQLWGLLIVEAAIEVACRQYGLEGNEEFSQHIRESVAYRNNSADWESLLGELFDAERVEARQDVLTKALQMAGAYPADLPRLAIASLRRFDVHVSGHAAVRGGLLAAASRCWIRRSCRGDASSASAVRSRSRARLIGTPASVHARTGDGLSGCSHQPEVHANG